MCYCNLIGESNAMYLQQGTKISLKRWTPEQIRSARQTPLRPVLEELGYRLEHIKDGNFSVIGCHAEVIMKNHYWVCSDNGQSGNAIDFLVKIEGLRFEQAIKLLLDHSQRPDPS